MIKESAKLTAVPLASIAAYFIIGEAYVESTKAAIEIRAWAQHIITVRD